MNTENCLVLLGAGASVEAGLPTSNSLTSQILGLPFEPDTLEGYCVRLIRIVATGIAFRKATNRSEFYDNAVNVEDISEVLQFLDSRARWKFEPFFNDVIPAISRLESEYRNWYRKRGLSESFSKLLCGDSSDLGVLDNAVAHILDDPSDYAGIHSRAQKVLQEECFKILRKPAENLEYLEPLARAERVSCIATLNYDCTVEETFRKVNRQFDVGVFEWRPNQLKIKEKHLPLLKLHGSVDWRLEFDPSDESENHVQHITKGKPTFTGFIGGSHFAIFGTPNKLRSSGPYLDLFDRFRADLEKIHSLYIIGYSFADKHINDLIISWLGQSKINKVAVASGPLEGKHHWLQGPLIYRRISYEQVDVTEMYAGQAIKSWFS